MTWEYIAGFFDGEGSITKKPKPEGRISNYYVSFPQSTAQALVLYEIGDFFRDNSIRFKIYADNQPGHTSMTRLVVTRYESIELLLSELIPHLRIKHGKAASALEEVKRGVERLKEKRARLKLAVELHLQGGKSYRSIEKQTRVDKRAVVKYINQMKSISVN